MNPADKESNLSDWRGSKIIFERVNIPDHQDLLTEEIAHFTQRSIYYETYEHLSFFQGRCHNGSHPHLLHECLSSISENRQPSPDGITKASWTAHSTCTHETAMKGGERIKIPKFSFEKF